MMKACCPPVDFEVTGVPPSKEENHYQVARQLHEVIESWRLVYDVYLETGLIQPNPYGTHTAEQAIGPHTAVFYSILDDQVESTLTAIEDSPGEGLPLDQVFQDELDELRFEGRRLIECGLFAHRGQLLQVPRWKQRTPGTRDVATASRINQSLHQLMRLALYFGINRYSTDFVIGVHPRHARFYGRAFGFRQVGPERNYPVVNDRPVVLLHGDLETSLSLPKTPHVLRHCWDNLVPPTAFEYRFGFEKDQVSCSWLTDREFGRSKFSGRISSFTRSRER